MGVPRACTLGCAHCLVAGSRDPAWLLASQRGGLQAELGEERFFLEDPALGLAPGLLGFSRVGDGGLAHSSAQRLQEAVFVGGGGLGRSTCLGSATWGVQRGIGGPLAGCSQAPSRQAPPSSGGLWPSPCPPRGTPGEEVARHKGAADLFSFALPWLPTQATHSSGDSWESSHCSHP